MMILGGSGVSLLIWLVGGMRYDGFTPWERGHSYFISGLPFSTIVLVSGYWISAHFVFLTALAKSTNF